MKRIQTFTRSLVNEQRSVGTFGVTITVVRIKLYGHVENRFYFERFENIISFSITFNYYKERHNFIDANYGMKLYQIEVKKNRRETCSYFGLYEVPFFFIFLCLFLTFISFRRVVFPKP